MAKKTVAKTGKPTKTTLARGATIQRTLLRRFLLRKIKAAGDTEAGTAFLAVLSWLHDQPIRAKRKGGIGRR